MEGRLFMGSFKRDLISATIVVIGVLVFSGISLWYLEKKTAFGQYWATQRNIQIIQMARVAADESRPVNIIFGPSEPMGILPPLLDEQVTNNPEGNDQFGVTYNFSARQVYAAFPNLVHRVIYEFKKRNKKPHFAFVFVAFHMMTKTASIKDGENQSRYKQQVDLFSISSNFLDHYLNVVRTSPFRFVLYGSPVNPARTMLRTRWLDDALKVQANFDRLWSGPEFHSNPPWDPALRGGFQWGLPKTQENFDQLAKQFQDQKAQGRMDAIWNKMLGTHDFIPDEELVDQMQQVIHELKQNARHVVLFHYPDQLLTVGAEALMRKENLKNKIKNISGIYWLDCGSLGGGLDLNSADYLELVHLVPAGLGKVTQCLVNKIIQIESDSH